MSEQDKTLKYYNENAAEYARQTLNTDMRNVMSVFLERIPAGGSILDLGCGSGRDSLTFRNRGYQVTAVDGSQELCGIASEYIGIPVKCMLFQELTYIDAFDGIWACSSLHHLSRNELMKTLPLVVHALKPGGILYTCFKYGIVDYEDEKGRHFTCATDETAQAVFEEVKDLCNLSKMKVWVSGDNLNGRDLQWTNVLITRKPTTNNASK